VRLHRGLNVLEKGLVDLPPEERLHSLLEFRVLEDLNVFHDQPGDGQTWMALLDDGLL